MFVNHKFILFVIALLKSKQVFGLQTTDAVDDDDLDSNIPSFRIVAPKFLCGDTPGDESPVPTSNEITISTQTLGGQKLTYRVQIYFVVLGKLKGQQHTLSIWKSVRQLQKKIASEKDDITLKNQISVHNSQLTPGVQYTFEIVGVDEAGRESKSQNFTIIYREGKFGKEFQQDGTSTTDEVSLLLIGSETAYGDMPIIIEARSIWCTPNNDFYMKWDIKPVDNRLLDYFNIKGKLLRIPSGVLKADETYQISVQLLKTEDDKFITKAEMRLTIMSREYSARILPEILMVGINNQVEINLVLKDSDNTGNKFNVMWSCQLTDGAACEDFTPSETTTQIVQFYTKGEYKISADVILSGVSKTVTSYINVNPDIIAYPQILNLPTKAISVNDNFELNAIINDLVPNCYAGWSVLEEAGFSYFNETQIPGGLGNMTIHDMEETFLSELVDYGNDTITRSIPLKIPKQNSEWDPEWPGLVSNSKYKFRLKIVCPQPIDDAKTEARKNIESYTDVVIETNAPPIPQPMEVEPVSGDSLRTIFKFSTGVAKDRPSDYPLKYAFYYVIDGYVINLGEFYETMVTTTDLPYSKSGIQTYYQVCDSRDACSNEVPGPNITITLIENVTAAELEFKKNFIQKNMETMNLETSFNTAIACLLTYQHFTDKKYFDQIKMTIIEAIKSTIRKIKNQEVFVYANDEILYFIKLSKKILDVIDYKQKDIYKGLLELLDSIDEYNSGMDESDASKGRMVDLFADIRRRVKRSDRNFANQRVNQRDKNRDKIITALDLYEKVYDDDELPDFVKRIEQEIRIFCKEIKDQKPLVYAKDYVAFEAIKTYDPQLFQEHALVIPFETYPGNKSKFTFSKKIPFPLDGNYCFAKIFYPKRNNANLADNENVYEFLLFQNGDEKKFRPPKPNTERNFLYEIPIIKVDDGQSLTCAIRTDVAAEWEHTNCESTGVTATVIKCRCLNFGLFSAVGVDLEKITSPVVQPVVPADDAANSITSTTLLTTTATNEQSTTTMLTTSTDEQDKITTTTLTTTIEAETLTETTTANASVTESTTVIPTTNNVPSSLPESTTSNPLSSVTETITPTTAAVSTVSNSPETTTLVSITTSIASSLPGTTTTTTDTVSPLSNLLTTTTLAPNPTTPPNSFPETTTIITDTVSTVSNLLETTNSTNISTTVITQPVTNVPATVEVTTATTNQPAITADNVEIINQTTKPLQIKDDLTTSVVTKLAITSLNSDSPTQTNKITEGKITDEGNGSNTTNATTGAKLITNSTDESDEVSESDSIAAIGMSSALAFVIFCGFFGLIFGVLYNKRKQKSTTVQETEISNSSVRQPSQGIRYARFHDASNMGGSGHFDESPIR